MPNDTTGEEPDMDEIFQRAVGYLKSSPDSPVKSLVKDLCGVIAFQNRGLKKSQAILQDLEADCRYWNVRVRVRQEVDKNLLVWTDTEQAAQSFWSHLYRNGYEDPEDYPEEPGDLPPGYARLSGD